MKSDRGLCLFRRTMGVILALVFSLTALPLWTISAENISEYALTEAVEYTGQPEQGVYTISTADQIKTLAEKVDEGYSYSGTTFKLTRNVDMSQICAKIQWGGWEPIGVDPAKPFSGTFDGGGYKITGLSMKIDKDLIEDYYQGLRSPNLPSSGNTNDYPCFGLFGYVDGTIQRLAVEGDILVDSVSSNYYFGGIVGYAKAKCTIKECEYAGKITTKRTAYRIGGIAGYNEGTVENCTNTGIIEMTGNVGPSKIGGIVGYNNGMVKGCWFTGSITTNSDRISRIDTIGGIVGIADSESTIENCTNIGDITITNASNLDGIGGIVGSVAAEVKNCTNEGNITVETVADGYANTKVGGIAGSVSDEIVAEITGCTNTGAVKAENVWYVGGITGVIGADRQTSVNTIADCANIGTVTGLNWVGGIVGACENITIIEKCYNQGKVVAVREYAGGIVGCDRYDDVIIDNCYNTGSIGSIEGVNVGGIIGRGNTNSTYESYYLDTCGAAGEGTSATKIQFNSGEIAYLMQKVGPWGQRLTGSGDSYPILTDKPGEKVLKVIFVTDNDPSYHVGYANPNGAVEIFPEAPIRDGYLFYKWTADGKITGEELANHVNADGATVYPTWRYLAPNEVRAEVTEAAVTITYPTGDEYEYALDDGEWQDSPEFDGLTSGTHTVHARHKGTDEIAPSESTSAVVTVEQQSETTPAESETTPSGGGSTGTTKYPSGGGVVTVSSDTSDTETVTVTVENKITGDIQNLTATRDGDTVTVELGKENDGLYANVYDTNSGNFVTAALIEDGKAVFTLAKSIKFNIVIDSFAHGDDVSSASGIHTVSDVAETAVPVVGFIVPAAVSFTMILKLKKKKSVK